MFDTRRTRTEPRKTFREWKPQEYVHRAAIQPSAVLPPDDLVFFFLDLVRKLDLSAFMRPTSKRREGLRRSMCG
ncbi:MAG: hypothetical protein GXP27_06330 [Planctomycetes bacterium]|nr:hypothetical protein [Planctomycetota bacterium]